MTNKKIGLVFTASNLLLLAVLLLLVSAVWAADTATAPAASGSGAVSAPADVPTRAMRQAGAAQRRSGAAADRELMYQDATARRMAEHRAQIAELEEIKKVAQEENASRTVEAIQKLIEKKDSQFKQSLEQFERQRRARLEQIQERTAALRAREGQTDAGADKNKPQNAAGDKADKDN
ncbi:MAG TPA: hypothetical protein PK052_09890 [Anaerohalosphaeraceae bacterium]|nr:hypothetical protein [Phycisphaerae bacterium]HOL32279.1 hypothetical protein [Anaerohalosphaeraceae bacterium]HOM76257.1 hypothetical protein [Anaerohalosphaeraceae bacterium]HPC64304.1 hypothetical protein [Anaerohalosphaeraceae bacterium]HPO70586.1 hypothetical protein [Anaerohalosphaeraceae bacterium]